MKIQKLQLSNFRGFRDLELELNGESVVLVGKNGAGKSSLLDAVAILFGPFLTMMLFKQQQVGPKMTFQDVSVGFKESIIEQSITFANKIYSWKMKAQNEALSEAIMMEDSSKNLTYLLNDMIHIRSQNERSVLPIVIYYSINRTVLEYSLKFEDVVKFKQLSAYENALVGGTDFRIFFEWYRYQEDLENENKIQKQQLDFEDIELKAVRNAIYSFLPGFSNLRVKRGRNQLVIDKGTQTLEINQLSDGEKCMLAMVGDLARRLAQANTGLENPLHGEGVVMIDEIELHLHPAWQREIVPRLQATFPNIQFILSTHSPQVLGEIQNMRLLMLEATDEGHKVIPYQTVFGKDSNRILEDVMGGSARDVSIQAKLEELFTAITNQQWEQVQQLKQELEAQIGTDEPELVKADVLIRRKRSLGR